MILSVKELAVSINGLHILQGLTFDVAGSGVTALLGRNGVGKTTTLRAMMGMTASTGSIVFAGYDISAVPTHRRVQFGLGYVPEDRCVFAGLTVAENLRLAERRPLKGRAEWKPPKGSAGRPVGEDLRPAERKPLGGAESAAGSESGVGEARREGGGEGAAGYELVYGIFPELAKRAKQKAGSLSGGQQQMLSLARALLNENRLLLVDEPTKGLAPKVVTEVAEVLERVAEAVPVLLVEQNLAVVRRLAKDAIVLEAGRMAWAGDAGELLGDSELTKSLLGVGR